MSAETLKDIYAYTMKFLLGLLFVMFMAPFLIIIRIYLFFRRE